MTVQEPEPKSKERPLTRSELRFEEKRRRKRQKRLEEIRKRKALELEQAQHDETN